MQMIFEQHRLVSNVFRKTLLIACAILPAACGFFDDEEILPGERLDIRPATESLLADGGLAATLGTQTPVTLWPQMGGSADHTISHPALQASIAPRWTRSVGAGRTATTRITGAPVADSTAIYTVDALGGVQATSLTGQVLWRQTLTLDGERAADGFGGGASLDGTGTVFVTTGFGIVAALDAQTGTVLWEQRVSSPVRTAPALAGSRVIVVTRDNLAIGFDTQTGQRTWRVQGAIGGAGVLGGAQPAVDGLIAVIPFSSGEVIAAFARTGRRVWSTALTGGRRGEARASIGDITGDPVISGGDAFVGNQSGSFVSINILSGQRNWTQPHGVMDMPLVTGDSVFAVTDEAVLVRLDRVSGDVIWGRQLPQRPSARADSVIQYFGPTLAGGRLFIGAGDGDVIIVDPSDGSDLGALSVGSGAAAAPIVIGGQLIVLGADGTLRSFQ